MRKKKILSQPEAGGPCGGTGGGLPDIPLPDG